jgi:hypothetical protein
VPTNNTYNDIEKYSLYLHDNTNTTYDMLVDKQILKRGDSASAYMSRHTQDPKYKGIDKTVAESETLLEYFIHLFKTYSEPFDSSVVVRDTSTNLIYDLSSNYELYKSENKIVVGKHDSTDYEKILKSLNDKYHQLDALKPTACEEIKCIADFGTKIGDDLCCGQEGTLKDTRYACPSEFPTCGDFKCGSKFGKCS